MAPVRSLRRSYVRTAVIASVLAGSITLGLTGGEQWATALTTGRSTTTHSQSHWVAAGYTVRPSLLGRSEPSPADVPAQAPAAPVAAAPAPAAPARATQPRAAAPAPVSAPVSAPASYRSRLVSADGSLNTGIGYYSDCTGRTPLTRSSAAIDTCVGGRTYFVGHNPGVFTPLMHMGVGSIITWYDGSGNAHRLRIISVRSMAHAGVPSLVGGATVEFQTCITPDASFNRILDAAPA